MLQVWHVRRRFHVWTMVALCNCILLGGLVEARTGWAKDAAHVKLPTKAERAALPEDGGSPYNRLVFEQSPYLLQHNSTYLSRS